MKKKYETWLEQYRVFNHLKTRDEAIEALISNYKAWNQFCARSMDEYFKDIQKEGA